MQLLAVICAKNIGLFSIAGIMFWLVGYNLAYGIPEGGYIGKFVPWSDASAVDTGYSDGSDWYFQMVFCATTVSIVSGTLAERIKIWPFFLFAAILTGIIYPIEMGWHNIFKILNVPIVGEIMMRFFGLPLIKKRALEWNKDESINEDFIEKYINQLSLPGTEYALLSASRNLFPKNYEYIYEVFSKNKIPFHIAYADDDTEVSPDSVRAIIKINNDADVFMFTGGHGGSAKIPQVAI